MKQIISAFGLLAAFSVSVAAQGTAVRATNGIARGVTLTSSVTNSAFTVYLGAGALGTTYALIDTNGTGRFFIQGANVGMRDANGDSVLTVSDDVIVGANNAVFVGNGAGLTNLASATNFPAGPTYNFSGKASFTSNVFLTMLSFATNKFDGPTNTLLLVTNLQKYVTATDVNITNIGGQTSTNFTWAALILSNSTAASITARVTSPGTRFQGLGSTNALTIPAGKEGFYIVGSWATLTTNVWSWVQDQGFSGSFDTFTALNAYLTNVYMGNLTITNFYVGSLFATNAYILTNTAPVAPLTNLFVLGTRYTNGNQRAFVSQCFTLNGAAAGTAAVTLSVEQGNGITNRASISAGPLASLSTIEQLSMIVSPTARYTFTDATSGTGATVSAVTNSACWIGL